MKTKGIRMYGANDIRLEEFELPEITEEEVLIRVVSDSVCASTYKAIKQGSAHKRVPDDIAENPVIIGHEMCGEIVEVGAQAPWASAACLTAGTLPPRKEDLERITSQVYVKEVSATEFA